MPDWDGLLVFTTRHGARRAAAIRQDASKKSSVDGSTRPMGAFRRFDGFPLANDGAGFVVELVSFEELFQLAIGVRTKLDIWPGRRGRKEHLDTLLSDAVAAANARGSQTSITDIPINGLAVDLKVVGCLLWSENVRIRSALETTVARMRRLETIGREFRVQSGVRSLRLPLTHRTSQGSGLRPPDSGLVWKRPWNESQRMQATVTVRMSARKAKA